MVEEVVDYEFGRQLLRLDALSSGLSWPCNLVAVRVDEMPLG